MTHKNISNIRMIRTLSFIVNYVMSYTHFVVNVEVLLKE